MFPKVLLVFMDSLVQQEMVVVTGKSNEPENGSPHQCGCFQPNGISVGGGGKLSTT